MRRLLACGFLLCACAPATLLPGDQVMGTYAFEAVPLQVDCQIPDLQVAPFTFEATFSRERDGAGVWFLLNETVRDAGFDGQVARVAYEAPRVFGTACEGCATVLQERLEVALLSKSQNEAAGDRCPDAPLDGGLPTGPGVQPPGNVQSGFDAVRACGELTNQVVATALPDQTCPAFCGQCTLRYELKGARR